MKEINITSYPLGFFGDAHGNTNKLDLIRAKHPEITQWFFLGDIVCFRKPQNNKKAVEWLFKNIDILCLKGNHDEVCAKQRINLDYNHTWALACLERIAKINLPNGKNLFLCHAKPKDFWDFINLGYTEREFVDDFAGYIDEDTIAVINGHTHKALKHVFANVDTEIWNLGAADYGEYGILTEKGFEFKKL